MTEVPKMKGGKKMKGKVITTMMTALFMTFAIALPFSFPTVLAKTLKCNQTIYYNDWGIPGPLHDGKTLYWKGTFTGALSETCYF